MKYHIFMFITLLLLLPLTTAYVPAIDYEDTYCYEIAVPISFRTFYYYDVCVTATDELNSFEHLYDLMLETYNIELVNDTPEPEGRNGIRNDGMSVPDGDGLIYVFNPLVHLREVIEHD